MGRGSEPSPLGTVALPISLRFTSEPPTFVEGIKDPRTSNAPRLCRDADHRAAFELVWPAGLRRHGGLCRSQQGVPARIPASRASAFHPRRVLAAVQEGRPTHPCMGIRQDPRYSPLTSLASKLDSGAHAPTRTLNRMGRSPNVADVCRGRCGQRMGAAFAHHVANAACEANSTLPSS